MNSSVFFRASWQKQVSRTNKVLTAVEVRERNTPSDSSLVCPIDNKLFRDALKTPCCGTCYCEDCIQTYLLERDFICPNCGKKIASLDKLSADMEQRRRVNDYIENAIEESRREAAATDEMEDGSKVPPKPPVYSKPLNFNSRIRSIWNKTSTLMSNQGSTCSRCLYRASHSSKLRSPKYPSCSKTLRFLPTSVSRPRCSKSS